MQVHGASAVTGVCDTVSLHRAPPLRRWIVRECSVASRLRSLRSPLRGLGPTLRAPAGPATIGASASKWRRRGNSRFDTRGPARSSPNVLTSAPDGATLTAGHRPGEQHVNAATMVELHGAKDVCGRKWWLFAACVIVLFGIAFRAVVDFSHPYPPGTDAGYYPLQTRSLIADGRLMYADLPLVFWVDAALARLLQIAGLGLDTAVLDASRVLNAFAPPLVAGAVFGLGYAWSAGSRRALPGIVAAALFSVASCPIVQAFGFQKASLGLVWMAFEVWACRSAMLHGAWWRWMLVGVFLLLAALTHVGAFALTMFFVVIASGYWLWRGRARSRRLGLLMVVAAAAVFYGLLLFVDPRRGQALLGGTVAMFVPTLVGPGFGLDNAGKALWVAVVTVLLAGVRWLHRDRTDLQDADVAVVGALAVTCAVLVWPKSASHFYRLLLMAPIPAALLLAFVNRRQTVRGESLWPTAVLLSLAVAAAVQSAWMVPPRVVDERLAGELVELRSQVPEPGTTLVIAPHGLEWFAGYFLHTPVRQGPYGTVHRQDLPADSFARYRRVLFLRFLRFAGTAVRQGVAGDADLVRLRYRGRTLEMYEIFPQP